MIFKRFQALIVIILGALLALFIYNSEPGLGGDEVEPKAFKLGLDLSGGVSLTYKADLSGVPDGEIKDSMSALRDVIERRVNLFGVSEASVVTQDPGIANNDYKVIIDLPGVTDIDQAVSMIGQTPLLEFKTERPEGPEQDRLIEEFEALLPQIESGEIPLTSVEDPYFVRTELTGRYLKRAVLDFSQTGGFSTEPVVSLEFDKEGADLFEQITAENVGKVVAIYLDGAPISTPVVREAISGGQAVISGSFSPEEAKILVGRLNSGALPVPIERISTQSIGPSLGTAAVDSGVRAGVISFIILSALFILWYRLPGVVAVVALGIYASIMFTLFKIIPVTLTASGIAGFIISLGLAVDANILIFERLKEEMKDGRTIKDAITNGFSRAWLSIRDSNLSSVITAAILFWFGSALIKGFALTFGIGVLASMLSAIVVTKIILIGVSPRVEDSISKKLFGSGFGK